MAENNAKAKKLPASPGIMGAVKDAFSAVVGATAPRSVVQRGAKIDAQADGTDRLRNNQTSDKHN